MTSGQVKGLTLSLCFFLYLWKGERGRQARDCNPRIDSDARRASFIPFSVPLPPTWNVLAFNCPAFSFAFHFERPTVRYNISLVLLSRSDREGRKRTGLPRIRRILARDFWDVFSNPFRKWQHWFYVHPSRNRCLDAFFFYSSRRFLCFVTKKISISYDDFDGIHRARITE